MAKVLTTDAAKEALGIKGVASNVAAKPISLNQMQQLLAFLDNDLVQRYATPLLDMVFSRVGLAPKQIGGASDLSQQVPPRSGPEMRPQKIVVNMTGERAFDMFTGFMGQMDPKIPIGEFNALLVSKRESIIKVFDNALGKDTT